MPCPKRSSPGRQTADGTVVTVNVYECFAPSLVTLPAGQHRLVLSFPTDYVNINWITFALRG